MPFLMDARRGAAGLFAVLLLLYFGTALAQQPAKDQAPETPLTGDAVCTRCHDQDDPYQVLAITKTPHGVRADQRTPTCQGCHGESLAHLEKESSGKGQKRAGPDISFGPSKRAPAEKQNAACLSCHQGGKLVLWSGSSHDNRDTACTSCHELHTAHDKVKRKQTQPEVCFTCHKEQRILISRPSHHPIKEGKMVCSDCHNAHGSAGPKLMVRDNIPDTCYACHMEKRGPFTRNHQPVTEDCSICHNPHGSTVDNLLKSRPPFLCQQCHEPATHQGNFPGFAAGFTNSAGVRGLTQARACLNCHTNIHGSNNPTGAGNARTFRR